MRSREDHWARALIAVAAVLQVALTLRLFEYPGEPAGDDMTIHMAEVAAMARSLGAGDFDLWNPSANAGFASAYYYQMLPQLGCALLYLALNWLISLATLFKLTCVAALVALPLAVYRGLRVLGARAMAAAAGGFAASFVYADSGWGTGIDSLFASGLYTQAFALALYPLAGAYAVRYLLGGQHFGRAVIYTLLCGLCHPFVAFALAPAMLVAPWWRVTPAVLARRAALLLAAVLLTSAPLWLPILIHYDTFGGFPARVAGEEGIAAAVFGPSFLEGSYLDAGRLPVLSVLAPAALLGGLIRDRQWRLAAAVAAAGLLYAALIVIGPLVPKTRGDLIPAIRFLAPMQLCLAAGAGAALATGASLLIARARAAAVDLRMPRWIPTAAVLASCAIAAVAAVQGGVARAAKRVKTIEHYEDLDRDELGQVIDYLRAHRRGRVYADGELGTGSHWWMYLPYVLADRPAVRAYGGASLQSSPNFAFLRSHFVLPRHWKHFAVRYVLAASDIDIDPERLAGARRVFATEHYDVWAYPPQTLWAPVIVGARAAADRDEKIERGLAWMMATERDDPAVVVFGDGPDGPLAPPHQVRIRQVREERAYHRAVIDVDGERPALVRLAVSIHPGWRATVGGERAAIVEVSPAFMAVVVPPGRHVVRFEFARPWWTWLLWGLLIAAGIAALWRRRRAVAVAGLIALLAAAPDSAAAQPRHAPADAAFAPGGAAVISTAAGVWIRSGAGEPFEYLCPEAAGSEARVFEPRVAVAGDRVLVAGYRGLRAGLGCALEPVALLGPRGRPATTLWIESIAAGAGGVLWAATADATSANDVYRGRGDHLESAGLRSQTRWYLSALPAPSDPAVVYASGYQVAPPAAAIEVSSDGRRFTAAAARGLGLGRSYRSRFVAVDPRDPDTAYLVAEAVLEPRGDVLYRTRDRAASFTELLSPRAPIDAVAIHGKAVWIAVAGPCSGGRGPGCLIRLAGTGGARESPGPRLACLTVDDRDRLIGCRADAMTSGVALVAIDRTGAQHPVLHTRDLAPPCPAAAARCAPDWARACKALGAPCIRARPPAIKNTARRASKPRRIWWLVIILVAIAPLPWLVRKRWRRGNR